MHCPEEDTDGDLRLSDAFFEHASRFSAPTPAPAAAPSRMKRAACRNEQPQERGNHRRTAAERNFRRLNSGAAPSMEFRPSFGLRRRNAAGTIPPAAFNPLEQMPYFMAGMGAIAAMPEEAEAKPGRKLVRLGTGAAVCMLLAYAAVMAGKPTAAMSAAGTPGEIISSTYSLPVMKGRVEAFFAARTPEEKAPLVRGGTNMLPAMRAYYAQHPDEQAGFSYEDHVARTDLPAPDGSVFVNILGHDSSGKSVCALALCSGDEVLLDWRALTGAGEMDWRQWIQEQPQKQVLCRVEAVPDAYVPSVFGQPDKFFSLRIFDADGSASARACVERESPLGKRLMFRFGSGGSEPAKQLRLAAVLECPPGASPHDPCARIVSVSPHGWCDLSEEAGGACDP